MDYELFSSMPMIDFVVYCNLKVRRFSNVDVKQSVDNYVKKYGSNPTDVWINKCNERLADEFQKVYPNIICHVMLSGVGGNEIEFSAPTSNESVKIFESVALLKKTRKQLKKEAAIKAVNKAVVVHFEKSKRGRKKKKQ